MNDSVIKKLVVLDADYWSAPITETRLNAFSEQLSDCDPVEIKNAMKFFRNEAGRTRMPMPADLKNVMAGFPSAEEVYALIPRDESQSCVWTNEAALAYSACAPLLAVGDFYGARLAFMSAYENAVSVAKQEGKRVKWSASLGTDRSGREKAVLDAINKNRIKVSAALEWTPDLQLTNSMKNKLNNECGEKLMLSHSSSEVEISEEQRDGNLFMVSKLLEKLGSKN